MGYIYCDFAFHNIGQGTFYSGQLINNKREKFSFIYDCGTISKKENLNKSIQQFKKTIESKLDLIVLSHFDADHVNGLEKLLKNLQVSTIVIPYIDPLTRLIISIKNPLQTQEYYRFLSDPISFLLNYDVENIIVIGESDYVSDFEIDDPYINPQDNNFNGSETILLDKLQENHTLRESVIHNEGEIYSPHVKFTSINGHLSWGSYWIFKFFNYSVTNIKIEAFINYIDSKGIDSSNLNLKKIITNNETRKILKDGYKKIFSDLNNTSLVLYHGPIIKDFYVESYIETRAFLESRLYYLLPYNPFHEYNKQQLIREFNTYGTLLLGDINLNLKYDELINHFHKYLENLLIVSVPHHGSIKSWNDQILNDLNDFSFWIYSFGLNNRFDHPNQQIVKTLNEEIPLKFPIYCHEINKVFIRSLISFK